jgi:hypothetical protein
MFKRRIGPDPHTTGEMTSNASGCPDIWELENGDFAVIGLRKTSSLLPLLPSTATCGADEEIVVISRRRLLQAKDEIPTT